MKDPQTSYLVPKGPVLIKEMIKMFSVQRDVTLFVKGGETF